MARRLPYREGDLIGVPLGRGPEPDGWGRGLIARMNGRGIVLGYFAGPRSATPPTPDEPPISPSDVVLVAQFGHLGLKDGSWLNLGPMPGFDRARWGVPRFGHRDLLRLDLGAIIELDEESLQEKTRRSVPVEEVATLPEDGLHGAVSLQIALGRRLSA